MDKKDILIIDHISIFGNNNDVDFDSIKLISNLLKSIKRQNKINSILDIIDEV